MEDFKDYAEALNQSAKGSRSVIFSILIASIVIFIPYWNVRPNNWLSTRIRLRENVVKWYGWSVSSRAKLNTEDKKEFDNSKEAAQLFGLTIDSTVSDQQKERELKRITNEIELLRKIYSERSFFTIPVFNVVVDINDMGILGSLAFITLLSILRAYLWREYLNLKIVFDPDNDLTAREYYILSMGLVLIVPPQKSSGHRLLWTYIFNFYLLLPFAVQSYCCFLNFQEIQFGLTQNYSETLFNIYFCAISVIIIFYLSYSCINIIRKAYNMWKAQAIRLKIIN